MMDVTTMRYLSTTQKREIMEHPSIYMMNGTGKKLLNEEAQAQKCKYWIFTLTCSS